MEPLHKKVIEKLRERLDGQLEDGLEFVPGSGRVTGWVSAAIFDGKGDRERQRMLWDVLEQELAQDERSKIGPIVALTPTEAQFDVTADR